VSLLSKSEIHFLQNQKQVSKSYEYKLKSILKKKLSVLLEKELPLLSKLFSDFDITVLSNNANKEFKDLTIFSKIANEKTLNNLTKISKNIQNKEEDTLPKPIKLVACEGLEGSNLTPNDSSNEKATEYSKINIKSYKSAPGEGFESLALT
jgi:hypothetical protein